MKIREKNKHTTILAVLPDDVSVVVFDVDNTIVKGTTVAHSGGVRKVLSPRHAPTAMRVILHSAVYNIFSVENGVHFIKNKGLSLLENYPSSDLKKTMCANLSRKLDIKIYPNVAESIKHYKTEGKIVVLASAAPDFLVQIVADKVKADYYIGTVLEENNGVFTGRTVGSVNHGSSKAVNVKNLIQQLGIPDAKVASFTDSMKDIDLLNIADYKIAVNPDFKLRKSARKNKWVLVDLSPRHKVLKIVGLGSITASTLGMILVALRKK